MANRVLPNNLEAEQSVLGSCFLSKYALQKAAESLTAESFYNEKNGLEKEVSYDENGLVEEYTIYENIYI